MMASLSRHLAQLSRIDDSDYPAVQEHENDDKPATHANAGIIHLCPDTVDYLDAELAKTPPFSEATAEISSKLVSIANRLNFCR